MNEFLDKVSSHITGKENISESDVEELERLALEHPYFSVSHLLLAKKYKSENHSDFLPQVQKAAIFYNNPYWLHYQLLDARPEFIVTDDVKTSEEKMAVQETSVITGEVSATIEVEEKMKPEVVLTNEEIIAADSLAKQTLAYQEVKPDEEEDEETEITPDELHPEREEILEEIQEQNLEPELIPFTADNQPETEEEGDITTHPSDNTLDDIHPAEQTEQTEEPVAEKDLIETVVESTIVQPVSIDESLELTDASNSEVKDEQPTPSETAGQPETLTDSPIQSAPSPVINEPLIPIEPYYTVDYFASQGIKLVLDKNPQDKLGKQLRSFTDWLKHMKKLGPEDALKSSADTPVDPVIKDIADTSNTPEEIVTEAMAEVLVKQGKTDQAIEVYHKLSFLNPDKSAYFADQIQKLKGT